MNGKERSFPLAGPEHLGRAGLLACGISVALIVVTGLLGPSAAQLPYPPPGVTRFFSTTPPSGVVTALLAIAILLGAAGVTLAWLAMRRGWCPSPRRLIVGGLLCAAVVSAVPPMGSTDLVMYTGYGRLADLGINPYVHSVDDLPHKVEPNEHVLEGAEPTSVYGPVALAAFWLAAEAGEPSSRNTVWLLQLLALACFAVVALLLDRAARTSDRAESDRARARVALLWTFNPILLFEIVNAAHIDTLAVAIGLSALLVASRSALGSGALVALSIAVKISFGLYAAAIAWALLRRPRRLIEYLLAATVVGLALFLPFWPGILDPLKQAAGWVASESPWHLVDVALTGHFAPTTLRRLISLGALVLLVVVVRRLNLGLPQGSDDARGRSVRTATLLTTAWLLTAPYALPWYDAFAWAPLVLLPASGVDLVVLTRLTIVALAYLPGAGTLNGFSGEVRNVVHDGLTPLLSIALVVIVIFAGPRLALSREPSSQRTPLSPG